MLFFFYFLIGHLIGDFLFQTSTLVRWKFRSQMGIFVHVLLIFISTLLLFGPYLYSSIIWLALFINAVIHYGIDYLKVEYDKKHSPHNPLPAFWVDQMAHVGTFTIIIALLPDLSPKYLVDSWWFEYYEQTNLLLYIAGFLFFSYFMDILYFMFQLKSGDKKPYQRSYYSMVIHTFLFAILFTLTWTIGHFYLRIF